MQKGPIQQFGFGKSIRDFSTRKQLDRFSERKQHSRRCRQQNDPADCPRRGRRPNQRQMPCELDDYWLMRADFDRQQNHTKPDSLEGAGSRSVGGDWSFQRPHDSFTHFQQLERSYPCCRAGICRHHENRVQEVVNFKIRKISSTS